MAEPLKYLYNETFFNKLVKDFQKNYPDFKAKAFLGKIFDEEWDARELKDRMRHITLSLHDILDLPYAKAIELLKKVIPNNTGFEYMFFPDYVEVFGMEDLDISLDAMAHFTEWASAEFAIRPFIIKYEKETMQQIAEWAEHENHHIRRLASEGCRPRLPWAMALPKYKKDPAPVLPILEKLQNDPSEYVRRSVANNLNDISKDHPDLVLDIAEKWLGQTKETDWIVKHALRGLLKQGNTRALLFFGFGNPENIAVQNLSLHPNPVKIGGNLFFQFEIHNLADSPERLRIEYAIDYVKKTGKTSRKVFKITENEYTSGITKMERKQRFKDFTTRTHYPGQHGLAIVVNGMVKREAEFEVEK